MRIVMLTDDAQIDRRILLEAETLAGAGHELILLAGKAPDQPSHHFEGSVKVERIGPPPAPRSRRRIESARDRYSGASSRASGKLALWNERVQAGTQRWWRPAGGSVRVLCRAGTRVARGSLARQDGMVQRGARLLGRLDQRWRQLDDRETHLVERMRFYRPDLLHAHDLPQLRPAVAAKRALGVPLVYDAHELYPEIHTLTPPQQEMLAKREARYVRSCDLVITVNGYMARLMAQRYGIREPAVILNATAAPPGFDERERYDRFRAALPIPPDAAILLYQGWMAHDRPGLDPLVRSMALVKNPRVHLVMMGYGDGLDVFPTLARELGTSHRVHFQEAVSQSELLFWTASADAGIIPYVPVDRNIRFCSPNKLYELITARLPILANDLPYLRDVVAANGFGLIRKLEAPADFASAIDEMFVDFPAGTARFRDSMIRSGDRFAWSVEHEKLLSLYERFLAKQPAPAGAAARRVMQAAR
jgi:glycosyltransferase involved in cell wall biosynthesis